MRICIVTSGRRVAPVEAGHPVTAHTYFLAKHLVQRGHDVEMITFTADTRTPQQYPVKRVGRPRLKEGGLLGYVWNEVTYGLGVSRSLAKLHRQRPVDLAYMEDRPAAFLTLMLNKAARLPHIALWHGGPIQQSSPDTQGQSARKAVHGDGQGWRSLVQRGIAWASSGTQRWLYRHSVSVVAQSQLLKRYLVDDLGAQEDRVHVVPACLDGDVFHPNVDAQSLREQLGLTGKLVVLCIGAIAPYKNQEAIIRAAPAILGAVPNAHFLFAGPIASPDYHDELLRLAQTNGSSDSVSFTGMVPYYVDLPPYFALADVYALVSLAEGGVPATAMEAMSCSRPVILSTIPQIKEQLPSDGGAALLDPHDIEALTAQIVRLLQDREEREAMGRKARETALERFDWKRIIPEYEGAFQRILQSPSAEVSKPQR